MQIAKTETLREKSAANDAGWKRALRQLQLPLALIAIAMLGYIVIVRQWL